MLNCAQMKERKCGKDILKCANAKCQDYHLLFQLSPGVSTIRTHYKPETFSSRVDDTEDFIFVMTNLYLIKYFVDIGIF